MAHGLLAYIQQLGINRDNTLTAYIEVSQESFSTPARDYSPEFGCGILGAYTRCRRCHPTLVFY
jgi:hypothetical protein